MLALMEACSLVVEFASAITLSMSSCSHNFGKSDRSIMISNSENWNGDGANTGLESVMCMTWPSKRLTLRASVVITGIPSPRNRFRESRPRQVMRTNWLRLIM